MDWTKFLHPKIYDRNKFLVTIASIFVSILFLLILINAFSTKTYTINFTSAVEVVRNILKGKRGYWGPEPILITLFTLLVLWFLVFFEGLISLVWHMFFSPHSWRLNEDFNFNCFNDLEIQGNTSGKDKTLKFSSSAAGVLLKNNYWNDFKVEFDFNFETLKTGLEMDTVKVNGKYQNLYHKPLNNYFALLFRAKDLNNYFMISVGIKQIIKSYLQTKVINNKSYKSKKRLLITPHVKVDGKWDVFTGKEFAMTGIKISDFNHVVCSVEGNIMTLNVGKSLKDYKWILPSKFRANYTGDDLAKYKDTNGLIYGDPTTISFRNIYGMIGFRAYGEEHVTIKNLVIAKL